MTGTAVLLILISSVTHAGWNLLGKSHRASPAGFVIANLAGAALLLPFALSFGSIVRAIPAEVWLLLFLTGLFQTIYYASLAAAYRRGDMSVVYPLVRSIPIVLVTAVSLVLGRGSAISGLNLCGFVLIVAGAFLLPLQSFRGLSFNRYLGAWLPFALLAAAGTAGYSIVDSDSLHILRRIVEAITSAPQSPATIQAPWQAALVYSFFESLTSTIWLAVVLVPTRTGRQSLRGAFRGAELRGSALMGVGIYLTYTLVLISMGFVSDISYVVAFRQLSIPIGVTLGIMVLKEPPRLPRIVAAAVMVAGLALSAVG
ncbi:MAG TPA: EamA family transporter [Spirochaetia bacterium]|nr:EamA family transporter [Spirochaetia bacterium]